MIKRIKNSLTINICILIAVLLIASSGITYAVIVGFLPTYYSKQLQKDIDSVSQEMIETIHSMKRLMKLLMLLNCLKQVRKFQS